MGSFKQKELPPLIENAVQDIFVSGIARIQKLGGGNFGFVIFVDKEIADGVPVREPVVRLICHVSIIGPAIRQVTQRCLCMGTEVVSHGFVIWLVGF